MKLQLYPPPINIYFLFSFQVFFSHFRVLVPIDARVVPPTQCRNPSGNPFENPFNNLISSISSRFILVYPIFTRITTIIFTYLQTGKIFWLNDALIWRCTLFLIRERDTRFRIFQFPVSDFCHRNHIFTYLQTGMIFLLIF